MGDSEDSMSPLVKNVAQVPPSSPRSPRSSSSAQGPPSPLLGMGGSVHGQAMQLMMADQLGMGGQFQRARTRRSRSAPMVSTTYGFDESMGVESSFLKIGDRVAFFSEKDQSQGFVSTLG